MNTPPLAIVQARMGSTRLPGKMLLPLGGKPLVWHAWNAAVEAFGNENVVCTVPSTGQNFRLADVLRGFGANVVVCNGDERDVLTRLWTIANANRWRPESVIVRVTPDDFKKDPDAMRRVAAGARLPVEIGAEAFTLAMLDNAHRTTYGPAREHVSHLLFQVPAPPPPPGVWSIDTLEDYSSALIEMDGNDVFQYVANRFGLANVGRDIPDQDAASCTAVFAKELIAGAGTREAVGWALYEAQKRTAQTEVA